MKKKRPIYKPLNAEPLREEVNELERAHHSHPSKETIYTNVNMQKHSSRQYLRENVYTYIAPQHRGENYLSDEAIIRRTKSDEFVQAFRETTRHWSKVVFGKSNALERKMDNILKSPDMGERLSRDILNNPSSVHSLAGYNFCGFKTKARKNAEKELVQLCSALDAYTDVVKQVRKQLMYTRQTKEKDFNLQAEGIAQYLHRTPEKQQHSQQQKVQPRGHALPKGVVM
ncbi:BID domain-containing T4SS effector [Bartonella sp. B39]